MITSNIKAIMEEKKASVRELSYTTGLSTTTIQKARRGKISQCRLCTLEVMAGYLGCKIKDLFDED